MSQTPIYPATHIGGAQDWITDSILDGQFCGPIEVGGKLYVLQPYTRNVGYGDLAVVMGSSDGGRTWTRQDPDNAMDCPAGYVYGYLPRYGTPLGYGSVIYFAETHYQWWGTTGYYSSVQTFDGTSGLFSSPVTLGINPGFTLTGSHLGEGGWYRRRSDGAHIFIGCNPGGSRLVWYVHDGSWSGENSIQAGIANVDDPNGLFLDSNDVLHFFYLDVMPSTGEMGQWYRRIDTNTGTMTSQELTAGSYWVFGDGIEVGNDIFFQAAKWDLLDDHWATPAVVRVRSKADSVPTISYHDVSDYNQQWLYWEPAMICVDSSGTLYYVWVTPDETYGNPTGGTKRIYYCTSSDGGSTWSTENLFHDEQASPTEASPDPLSALWAIAASVLANGELSVMFGLQLSNPPHDPRLYYFPHNFGANYAYFGQGFATRIGSSNYGFLV